MMNYIVKKDNLNSYIVVEVATENVIGGYNDYKMARAKAKYLNNGGGFDGWTPDFIFKNRVSFVENPIN